MNYKIFWFIKEGGIGAQKFFPESRKFRKSNGIAR
jgi:hypothetical protein